MTTTEKRETPPGDPYKPGVIVQRIIDAVGGPGGAGRGVDEIAHVWSERAVLAAWLHAHRRPSITRRLVADDFGWAWHRELFEHLCELDDQGVTVDLHSIRQHLLDARIAESEKHLDLVEMWADHGLGDADWHVARVLRAARQRAELTLSGAIQSRPDAAEEHHEAYRKTVADIDRRAVIGVATNYGENLRRTAQRLSLGVPPAIPTGFRDLDRLVGGLRPGGVFVVGARPGTGKSLLAVTIAAELCKTERARVGFISMEMNEGQVSNRIIADEAKISVDKLEKGGDALTEQDWIAFGLAQEAMASWPLEVVDGAYDQRAIRAFAEKTAAQAPRSLLIVDYLQRVQEPPGVASRERHVSQVSNTLKDIAVDLDMAVLAIASMSRESVRRGGKPRMSDLRDSGAVESDADVVLMLWQDGDDVQYPNLVHGLVDKNRYGETGETDFQRVGEYGRMLNLGRPGMHHQWQQGAA